MTSLFGSLEPFMPGLSTSFTRYVERVKIYFRANEVLDADRQRDIFLTVVGSTCYDRLVDLLAPRSPAEVSLDESVDILTTHYDPKPSKRVQRFHFNNRVQKQDESISDYIAELWHLAQYCEYGTQLEDMLCDRLIVVVRNDDLRRKLMTQKDAGFQRALEIAIAHETAARDARAVTVDQGGTSTPSETTSEVHLIRRQHIVDHGGHCQQHPPVRQLLKLVLHSHVQVVVVHTEDQSVDSAMQSVGSAGSWVTFPLYVAPNQHIAEQTVQSQAQQNQLVQLMW